MQDMLTDKQFGDLKEAVDDFLGLVEQILPSGLTDAMPGYTELAQLLEELEAE